MALLAQYEGVAAMRRLTLLGLLVAFCCCTGAGADEPRQFDPEKLKQLKEKLGGQFDPEKLKQLKEKLGGQFDPEKLKQLKDKKLGSGGDLGKLKTMTWKVGEVTREALVYAPSTSSAKPPLIFIFHGHGGTAQFAAGRKLGLHELWPEAVCVYPQGLPTPTPQIDPEGKRSGWQKFVGDQQDRDLAFFDQMLKTMKADYRIDEQRVYATGHSNGGYFTYVLWPSRGDTFAAVAPIAATLSIRDYKGQKPKPVLHVAGEKDPLVRFASQEKTMDMIRQLNGCDPMGKPAGKNCTEYTSRNGPPVVAFIHPGGHEVPDGAPERIVQFFKDHPKK